MANMKALLRDTAIYGLSSIVGRFLNYLLVPVYTLTLPAQTGGYGVITNVYAWVALLLVLLTCGMETGFFRFATNGRENPMTVYTTAATVVGSLSALFLCVGLLFLQPVAAWLGYAGHAWYVGVMMAVVAIDAFLCMPFTLLRYRQKALRFAVIKLVAIFVSIGLNLLYYVALGGREVGAAFLINLVSTLVTLACVFPQLVGFKWVVDKGLMRRMVGYCLPLLVLGVAGISNQAADKMLFPHIYPDKAKGIVELGIYGACVKIAMIMVMITQAFRYAYEPFVFGKSKDKDNKEVYARAMKFFVIFTLLAFLAVMFYLDVLRYLIGPDYWEGLRVVPIVLVAEICFGIYFNLSFWYKLIDETRWGAYFSLAGCATLVAVNVLFIPRYSYMACAWAGVAGYGVPMLLSYFVGQRRYPIRYDLRSMAVYVALAAVLYAVAMLPVIESLPLRLLYRTVWLLVFVAFTLWRDLPPRSLPVVGRWIGGNKKG